MWLLSAEATAGHSPFHKKLSCLLVPPYSGSNENLKLDFPSGPVVKTLPYRAGAVGSIPDLETCTPQLKNLRAAAKKKNRLRIV